MANNANIYLAGSIAKWPKFYDQKVECMVNGKGHDGYCTGLDVVTWFYLHIHMNILILIVMQKIWIFCLIFLNGYHTEHYHQRMVVFGKLPDTG